jgi:hypothetical protein
MTQVKTPTALTLEEVKSAVQGKLAPRKVKRSKVVVKKDKLGRLKGRPLGVATGLPVFGVWCLAFQRNAEKKLTDQAVSKFMKAEFPGRATADFDKVHIARLMYNRGRFTRGIKPRIPSKRYDSNGDIVHGRLRKAPTKPASKSKIIHAPIKNGMQSLAKKSKTKSG